MTDYSDTEFKSTIKVYLTRTCVYRKKETMTYFALCSFQIYRIFD